MNEFVKMQKKFVGLVDNTYTFQMIPQAVLIEGQNELSLNKAVSYLCGAIFCDEKQYDYKDETIQKYINGLSSDIIEFDLKDETLKKENILRIQNQFSKTSIEVTNKQVYIIKNIDKANSLVLNSLLKFLEEPHNNVYAIFTTKNSSKVLETIISRMIKIQLVANEIEIIKESYYENYNHNDVDFVSLISNDEIHIKEILDSEVYELFIKEINNILTMQSRNKLYMYLNLLFSGYKKDELGIFFELFYITLLNIDVLGFLNISEENINKIKNNIEIDLVLDVILSSRLKLDTNMNENLILDEFSIKLERTLL